MYLVDTNILIYAGKGIEPYASFLSKNVKRNQVSISAITVAEYFGGLKGSQKSFNNLLEFINTIDVDIEIARIAGNYRKQSNKLKKVYLLDCIIAATAKQNNLILVTANSKDYSMKDIKVKTIV